MTIFSLQIQSTYMFMRWSNNTVYYTDVFQISIFVFGQNKKLVWTIYYSKDFLSETLLSKNNQGTRSIPSDFFGEKGTRLIKSDFFGEKEGFQQQLFHVDYPLPLSCSLMIKQKHVKITQWNTDDKMFLFGEPWTSCKTRWQKYLIINWPLDTCSLILPASLQTLLMPVSSGKTFLACGRKQLSSSMLNHVRDIQEVFIKKSSFK